MAIVFQLIYGAWDAQLLKWQHQNLLGVSMKGWDIGYFRTNLYLYDPVWWIWITKLFLCWIEQVAAIFKIGNSKDMPEIPVHLSNDAKNFIMLCLQRDPLARPRAQILLDHPFIRDQSATKAANVNITRDAFPCIFDGSRTLVYCLWYLFIFFERSCYFLHASSIPINLTCCNCLEVWMTMIQWI